MNKLILGTMLTVGLCYGEVDYNRAMDNLGKCKLEKASPPGKEYLYFDCDSGAVSFDFNADEIFLSYSVRDSENKKVRISLLFNRGWNKKRTQIHKEKSVIVLMLDEFNIVTAGMEVLWDGKIYDFYKRFKEDVYYGKQEKVEYKKNYETTETRPVQRKEPNSLDENCWGDPNGSWFCE